MTALSEHPASAQLALFALCGELVVAIDAMAIHAIREAAELTARPAAPAAPGPLVLDLDGERVPAWDLGELLGVGPCIDAWVIGELPGRAGRVAIRLGRCITVAQLPVCRSLPGGIFTRQPAAISAAFSTAAIPELADRVSGVVVDLTRLLALRGDARATEPGKEGYATPHQG